MKPVCIKANDLHWKPAEGYGMGAEEKVLNEGNSVAPRAILLKIPPGWSMDAHSHLNTEMHYILEGQYESQGKKFPAGTFCVIPKEVKHGAYSTKSGAIILVTWCDLRQ
ncbi:MAG: cupin domain-containing protein [Candidatus Zixiibacteriota bacterium]